MFIDFTKKITNQLGSCFETGVNICGAMGF